MILGISTYWFLWTMAAIFTVVLWVFSINTIPFFPIKFFDNPLDMRVWLFAVTIILGFPIAIGLLLLENRMPAFFFYSFWSIWVTVLILASVYVGILYERIKEIKESEPEKPKRN